MVSSIFVKTAAQVVFRTAFVSRRGAIIELYLATLKRGTPGLNAEFFFARIPKRVCTFLVLPRNPLKNTIINALSKTVRFHPFLIIQKAQGGFRNQESFAKFSNSEYTHHIGIHSWV